MRNMSGLACALGLSALLASNAAFAAPLADTYEPTGDALYDAAAALILHEIDTRLEYGEVFGAEDGLGFVQSAAPHAALDIYRSFGEDSRFAELALLFETKGRRPVEAEKLIARGMATPGVFAAADPGEWYMDDEERALEICDIAIAGDSGNSHFHYRKAAILLSLGEWELAHAEVQAGNAAPRNAAVWPYPLDKIIRGEAGTAPANRMVAGYYQLTFADTRRWLRLKEMYKHVELGSSLGAADGRLLDDYLQCARRIGQMEHQSLAGVQCAKVYALGMLRRVTGGAELEDWTSELTGLAVLSGEDQAAAEAVKDTLYGLDSLALAAYPDSPQGETDWPAGYLLPFSVSTYGELFTLEHLAEGQGGVDQLQRLGEAAMQQAELVPPLQAVLDCLQPGLFQGWLE